MKKLLILACFLVSGMTYAQTNPYPLIPYPASLQPSTGFFEVNATTSLVVPADASLQPQVNQLKSLLGITRTTAGSGNRVILGYDASLGNEEAYTLEVNASMIKLSGKTNAGINRGIQTLRQLVMAGAAKKIPAVTIKDQPAYAWRGMHLDVSRHFFTLEYLKKYVDQLAFYKFNKFHLHLTDDQGWRIEIKKYPLLTQEGAWRTLNNQDSTCIARSKDNPDFVIDPRFLKMKDGKQVYGGFYTQEQIKELVAYAAERSVEIIPEIDMPGHMMAAIKQYPFLSCTSDAGWGKTFSTPICPCNEQTYQFAEDVFNEIFALFPSKYVHLGADEVEKTTWANSEACKALMQKEGIKNVEELQSYFVHRMQKFFASKGKQLIGWDEILEGGIDASAIVMYWRSWVKKAPYQAAKNGNAIVMTPVSTLYFDSPPGIQSVSNVYNLEVVPEGITPEQAKLFMGAQANLWTEFIPSENRAEYMYMPRMTALSEVVWTNKKDFASYEKRLLQHYPIMEKHNIHYRLPDLTGFTEENVFVDKATLSIKKPLESYRLRYTTDGSLPQKSSPELGKGLTITKPQTIKVAAFTSTGLRGDIYTLKYQQQAYAKPVSANGKKPGLTGSLYKKFFKMTTLMKQEKADSTFTVSNVVVPKTVIAPSFGIQFRGLINVPETGVYSFFYTCDDGGILRIADRMVVDNDGNHFPIEKSGQVALQKGAHPFEADFIEGGGGFTLKLKYSLNGSEPKEVPDSWFMR
ncbi:beta-hexosaminidase [Siphonobacter sp. BAB-5385]|uniref:family 20 glycosylhydrolase n=1 Tax=Siphonobacter sp. BAB-5385 TaxID=1864822 RepID=UPI000B9E885E|nr:family 20 glycosylhydrolase [Siphonobacter sp. BAB-5385]OZI08121.1 beta-hexosaminidase [Siphonobacter sp. BAB-5385]